jgi:hypothetical protein
LAFDLLAEGAGNKIKASQVSLGMLNLRNKIAVKNITNLLHLLLGVALLAVAVYFFRQLADNGKIWWRREASVTAQPARSAKPGSASDDPIPGAANAKVYGVFNQRDGSAGGDDAVPTASSGSAPFRDPAYAADAGAPNHFLHRRLTVKTFQSFEFDVPAHATRPQLEGTFQSIVPQPSSDGDPGVELLLMNAEQFSRFVNHKPVSAMFSSLPSSGGELYWTIKVPLDTLQKCYLVFRNISQGQGPSIVDADFTASFE